MIFHICPPDNKFIRSLIERFERVKPGYNKCIIIISRHHKNPGIDLDKSLIEYAGPLNETIIERIRRSACRGVIIHTLNDDILELSLNLPDHLPSIWRSWGTELYDLTGQENNLLLPATKKLVEGKSRLFRSSATFLRKGYHQVSGIEKLKKERKSKKREFLKRISFISTVTRTEYLNLKKHVTELNADRLILNYRSLDLKELPGIVNNNKRNDIIIGHSSYSYHNHADIFYILKDGSFKGSLIVPLSYGNVSYKKKIMALGKKMFNGQIDFLTRFLSFEDYLEFIGNYSAFIQNSRAQSGGGNTIYFLYQGSKVYLREENPIWTDFIEEGIKLFSIQKDLNPGHILEERIPPADILNNRKIIESLFGSQSERENVVKAYGAFSIPL